MHTFLVAERICLKIPLSESLKSLTIPQRTDWCLAVKLKSSERALENLHKATRKKFLKL